MNKIIHKKRGKIADMNLSFVGCGFLGHYYSGVVACLRKHAPHLLHNKISGASLGAMVGCWILCDLPVDCTLRHFVRFSPEARKSYLGPFHPDFKAVKFFHETLEQLLPEDAHLRVNGKLYISLTRVCDGKNVVISHFDSREDLIEALLASSFVPFVSGLILPKYKGTRYIDGAFSNNLLILDENTITVSPFSGKCDICPRDDSLIVFPINIVKVELSCRNIYRLYRIFFSSSLKVLLKLAKQGFDDTLRFLYTNNLIRCTRCFAIQYTSPVPEAMDKIYEYGPQCKECEKQKQEALDSDLPESIVMVYQEAIDSENNALTNYTSKDNGTFLSVFILSYALVAAILIYFIFF